MEEKFNLWCLATQLVPVCLWAPSRVQKVYELSNGKSIEALFRRLCSAALSVLFCCMSLCVCVCLCAISCVSATAFAVVAWGVKQIQSNGNTLESNSCSVKRGKTKPKNCWRQVELLEHLNDAVQYQAPGRNFPLNIYKDSGGMSKSL